MIYHNLVNPNLKLGFTRLLSIYENRLVIIYEAQLMSSLFSELRNKSFNNGDWIAGTVI